MFVFIVAIVIMVVMISRFKIHPFVSILLVSLVLGIVGGIPIVDTTAADGTVTKGIVNIITAGFSASFASIGLVIIFGGMIGTFLEATGATLRLADDTVRLVGQKRPALAIEIMGWIVSIPVFCDSAFVILNPVRKALVKKTGTSSVAMTMCLSAGLFASHVLIPPTPGPIAAANALGLGDNLMLVIACGALVSIPALAGAYGYARYISKKVKDSDEMTADETIQSYEALIASYGKLPGTMASLAPIAVPIILITISNLATTLGITGPLANALSFLGSPVIALAIGALLAVCLLVKSKRQESIYDLSNDTLKVIGPILFVTAAGAALGKVIASTSLVDFITSNANVFQTVGIFFPFLLAAILKTAQGSSTVAITTTAGIIAPLMAALGLDSQAMSVLSVMAIGAGAMVASHANDSYFWVVTNFGGLDVQKGYKTQTMVTLVEGVCAMIAVFIISLFV